MLLHRLGECHPEYNQSDYQKRRKHQLQVHFACLQHFVYEELMFSLKNVGSRSKLLLKIGGDSTTKTCDVLSRFWKELTIWL